MWENKYNVSDKVWVAGTIFGCEYLSLNRPYTISKVLRHNIHNTYLYELEESREGFRYHESRLRVTRVGVVHKLIYKLLYILR